MPDLWDDVTGQASASTILRRAVARDEVPHALLFVGPAGAGQREAARALAADLNCPQGPPHCGTCSTCTRIAAGAHPAVRDFEPEGASHVVDAVREEWIPAATRTLVEGRRKVLRIAAADRMNDATQNAFLKVLEEPPASVTWVVEAEDPEQLLDTVISRCRRIDFTLWMPADLDRHAQRLGVAAERRPALVRAAMGLPDRLADLADVEVDALVAARRAARDERKAKKPTDEELAQLRRDLSVAEARVRHVAIVGDLVREGPGHVVPLVAELVAWTKARQEVRAEANRRERERLEELYGGEWPAGVLPRLKKRHDRLEREERTRALRMLLDDLASYLRDLLVVVAGGSADAIVNIDQLDRLQRDAADVPLAVALDGLDAVAACLDAIERNGQPELQLERSFLRMAVGLYRAA